MKNQTIPGCRGDSLSYTRSISYFPWRQIIRQSIDAHEDDSPGEVRDKLGYVCNICTLPGDDIPFLEAMLAVESEESLQAVMGFQGEALTQKMIDATRVDSFVGWQWKARLSLCLMTCIGRMKPP